MDQVTTSSVEQKIQGFVLDKFPMSRKAGLDRESPLLERGILDSLGVLDVVGFLEGEFSIVIADDELVPEHFKSIGTLSSFVLKKLGKDA